MKGSRWVDLPEGGLNQFSEILTPCNTSSRLAKKDFSCKTNVKVPICKGNGQKRYMIKRPSVSMAMPDRCCRRSACSSPWSGGPPLCPKALRWLPPIGLNDMPHQCSTEVAGSRCTTGIIDAVPMRGTRAKQPGGIFTMNRRKTITFIAVFGILSSIWALSYLVNVWEKGAKRGSGRLHDERGAGHDIDLCHRPDRVVDTGELQRPGVAGTRDPPKGWAKPGRVTPSVSPPAFPRRAPAGRPSTPPSVRGSPRGSC